MEIKIIQSSQPHTGSTLLLNLVHGFLCPEQAYQWPTKHKINKYFITKTHDINIDKLIKTYSQYKLFFVVSERNKNIFPKKYINYDNVLIINYDEINVKNQVTLDVVIDNMFNKFNDFFPEKICLKQEDDIIKTNMKQRIINMNKVIEQIKHKPFSYCDKFYGVHGHHRNR